MFNTGIVLHYIKEYSSNEISRTKNEIIKHIEDNSLQQKFQNNELLENLVENLPIGTVICTDLSNSENKKTLICLPMFSSHISLPVKPGEIIWYYQDSYPFKEETKTGTPLLRIDSFWLSRKIGLKISEDLNYSHIQRDSIISNLSIDKENSINTIKNKTVKEKKEKKLIEKEELKKINIPDYESKKIYSSRYSFLPNTKELYKKTKENEDIFPTAVPRWSSKPYELTFQGSNNSLINLTKTYSSIKDHSNKGAVDLVAGRHFLNEFIELNENEIITVSDKIARNISDKEKRKIKEIKFNKSNPIAKIKNAEEDFELLKNQKYYFGEDLFDLSANEGFENLLNDASRIYITESDNVDNTSFYNTSNLQNQKILTPLEIGDTTLENEYLKDYLEKEESIKFSNFGSEAIKVEKVNLPSIFIKSNNIRLISREKFENKKEKKLLEEGSIRLVKQSNNFESYSHISMEKNGDVAIDGKTILLGNINKEYIRQGLIESPDDLPDEEKLKEMHGNGYGVLIGYDEAISEPLVLGNTLESILKEIIHINIQLVEEVKLITDDLQKHIHLGIPGSGVSGPPQVPAPYVDFSTTSQENLKKRYKDIQNNLIEILSRFAKTS
tara:strand:+ start:448 stop:2286 length:1839 start_codon:yes stop_codon:yes gene_type:complete